MKILIINNFFTQIGGVETYIKSLGDILRQKSHDVYFYATNLGPLFENNYEYADFFPKYNNFSKMKPKNFGEFMKNPAYFYNFEAYDNLDRLIQKIKPDIVHLNNIAYYLSPSVIKACKKNNVPTVMTVHDGFLACPDVGLLEKSEYYCNKHLCKSGNVFYCLKNRCNDNSLIKSTVSSAEFIFRKIHNLYPSIDAFIAPSLAIANIIESGGIKESKITHINNFINNKFLDLIPNFENKGYFLFVGRLVKEKGLRYLLQAIKNVPDISFKIAGSGEDEENLKIIASELNLRNVEFLGFKKGDELEDLYKNCIATILPSTYLEAFGLTILESFAYGKPVIGSNIGGIAELIINNKNGFLCEPNKTEELLSAIKSLYKNPQMTRQMGINARKCLANYSEDVYYSRLMQVYENLIN